MPINNIDDLYDEMNEAVMDDPDCPYDTDADREFIREPEWDCAAEMERDDDHCPGCGSEITQNGCTCRRL